MCQAVLNVLLGVMNGQLVHTTLAANTHQTVADTPEPFDASRFVQAKKYLHLLYIVIDHLKIINNLNNTIIEMKKKKS